MNIQGTQAMNAPAYPTPGDTWETPTSIPGLTVRFTVEVDEFTSPSDFDCYSGGEIEAFRSGDRWFVGVVASVAASGAVIAESAASLWGIDAGWDFDSSRYLAEVAEDLAAESRPEDTLRDFLAGFNV